MGEKSLCSNNVIRRINCALLYLFLFIFAKLKWIGKRLLNGGLITAEFFYFFFFCQYYCSLHQKPEHKIWASALKSEQIYWDGMKTCSLLDSHTASVVLMKVLIKTKDNEWRVIFTRLGSKTHKVITFNTQQSRKQAG